MESTAPRSPLGQRGGFCMIEERNGKGGRDLKDGKEFGRENIRKRLLSWRIANCRPWGFVKHCILVVSLYSVPSIRF